jgi:hypothetical protein
MDGHFYELARMEAVWEDRALPARRTEHPARSRGAVAAPAAGSLSVPRSRPDYPGQPSRFKVIATAQYSPPQDGD